MEVTRTADPAALARWHALNVALDRIAPLANAAADAITTAPADLRDYARAYAATLDGIRERLVASVRQAAPNDGGTP